MREGYSAKFTQRRARRSAQPLDVASLGIASADNRDRILVACRMAYLSTMARDRQGPRQAGVLPSVACSRYRSSVLHLDSKLSGVERFGLHGPSGFPGRLP